MHNRKDHRLSYADLSNQGQFNEKRLKKTYKLNPKLMTHSSRK